MFNVYRTQTPHVHCLIIFNQHDYTDCTELFLSHTEGTELTNGKVKTENGKRVWMIQLSTIPRLASSLLCCWNLILTFCLRSVESVECLNLSTWLHWLYGIIIIAHRRHGKHRFSLFHFDSHRTIRFLCMPLSRKLQIHLHLSIELHTEDKCLGNCVAGI